jgi:membrane-associated phospholipid phosphatase
MSTTLGLPIDNREEIPLKTKGDQSPFSPDLESGAFELSSPLNYKAQSLAEQQAISVLQVTVRRPFTPKSVVAIIWSLFPYVVPVFSVLSLIRHAVSGVSQGSSVSSGYSGFLLFFTLMAAFCVLLNERVLKRFIQEPRPAASAAKSYGMPSGHSTSCYAWMVWCIMELLAHPSSSAIFTLFLVVLCLVVLAPVPYARVYLQDHTEKQVLVGMGVGTIIGFIALPLRAVLFPHATPLWL